MNRKDFVKSLALLPLTLSPKLESINELLKSKDSTALMPVLFLGHGSPMNAIEENEFVTGFRNVAKNIQKPKTIHDFGGFPKELFAVQYPANGSPELAKETKELIKSTEVGLDYQWGLDHGAWSVIKHLYPKADIPVIQMSIDYTKPTKYHYELSKELAKLRQKGVLIIGSGNMVHNLRMVDWQRLNEIGYGYDWALEARTKMNKFILEGNHQALINYSANGRAFDLSIPSPEHFIPLLYTVGLQEKNEKVSLFNDKALAGSLTMTSVKIG